MALLKMKLDGEKYEVDLNKISLGEGRLLKREFGMKDFQDLDWWDPDVLTGVFAIAVMRTHPEMTFAEVLERVEGVESGPIFGELGKQIQAQIEKARAEQADPPRAAVSASAPAAAPGRSATSRRKPGTPRTRKS